MASLDAMQGAQNANNPTKQYSPEDAELATRMGIQMLKEGGGMQIIADAINQSQDPAEVIGKFLAQMMGQLAEKLHQKAGIDPGVFLAQGGFLDGILNYIEDQLGYPEDFSDKIYDSVLESIKAAAMQPTVPNEANQGQGPVNAPVPMDRGGI